MSTKINLKRFFTVLILAIFTATSLATLYSPAKARAISDEAKNRIYISGLAFCLYHKAAINEDADPSNDISTYWDKSGDYNIVIVGPLITSDSMMTCKEVLLEAGKALGFSSTDYTGMSKELEKAILGDHDGAGNGNDTLAQYPNGLPEGEDEFERLSREYIKNVLVKQYLDPSGGYPTTLPAISDEELAERLLFVVETCFNYRDNADGGITGPITDWAWEKDIVLGDGKTIDLDLKANDFPGDIATFLGLHLEADEGYLGGGYFGDDDLPPMIGGNGGDGEGLETANHSDENIGEHNDGDTNQLIDVYSKWYPFAFGTDNRTDMTPNGYDLDNGDRAYDGGLRFLVSCKSVEENAARIFKYYSLNTEGKLTINGKTSDQLLDEAPEDPNLTLTGDTQPTCEGADALGWILCPLIKGILIMNETIFNNFIVPLLTVDPINTSDGAIYAMWGAFRTVGNVLLVFALLFIVFGQSIGGGLVDAYTAKKAMPRIFIGAILINLSIYIAAFIIDIGNILGAGMAELIAIPAKKAGGLEIRADGMMAILLVIGLIVGVVLAFLLFAAIKNNKTGTVTEGRKTTFGFKEFMLYAVLFFGFPLMLIIISIFATLAIRLGLIMLLTAISPVALALFVLPSTEKWSKKWFELLIKAMLVYPIIAALFSIAYVLSAMLSNGGAGGLDFQTILLNASTGGVAGFFTGDGFYDSGISGSSLIFSLMSILVLFVPLGLIPFAFKLAGGLMGSLVGAVTKARAKTDTFVRGDKHDPYGRFRSTQKKLGGSLLSAKDNVIKGVYHGAKKGDVETVKEAFGAGSVGRFFSRRAGRRGGRTTPPDKPSFPTSATSSAHSAGASAVEKATTTEHAPLVVRPSSSDDFFADIPPTGPPGPTGPTGPTGPPGPTPTPPPWRAGDAPTSPVDYGFGSFGEPKPKQAAGAEEPDDGSNP